MDDKIKFDDQYFMNEAFKEAKKAFDKGEVPVGAVIVCNEKVIARAYNSTEILQDVTAHAEILAITSAASFLGSKYMPEARMYVTLEPCVMCAGALFWAQIGGLVYAADEPKRGYTKYSTSILHPKTQVRKGVMRTESASILQDFFKLKR